MTTVNTDELRRVLAQGWALIRIDGKPYEVVKVVTSIGAKTTNPSRKCVPLLIVKEKESETE